MTLTGNLRKGDFYYHSNYISKGAENPTKIAGFTELSDARLGIENIIFPGYRPSEKEIDIFTQKHKDIELISIGKRGPKGEPWVKTKAEDSYSQITGSMRKMR